MENVRNLFYEQLQEDCSVGAFEDTEYKPGSYSKKFGYYGKAEMIIDKAAWELSCGLINKDWKRVRNALVILGKYGENDGETEAGE